MALVLHNAICGLFYDHFSRTAGDEAVFSILALLVIPIHFIVSLVYTMITKVGKLVVNRIS